MTDVRGSGWVRRHIGALLGLAIPLGVGLATLNLAVPQSVAYAVPVIGLLVAVVLLRAQDRPGYLEFVLWLWLLTPWLRRVVDFKGSYDGESPVLLAAPLASLVAFVPGLLSRGHLHRDFSRLLGVAVVAYTYAFCVGLIRFGPTPAAVGAVTWFAPLAIGLWVAVSPVDDGALERALLRTATLGALVIGAYGAYQFFYLPEWDAHWMRNVELVSIGRPLPYEVRVFSTMNAPAPFAMVLGALLVVTTASVSRLRVPAAVLGFVSFGLSLVRTAWIGMAVALLVLLTSGRARAVRTVVFTLAIPVVLLLSVEGPAQEVVSDRLDSTVREVEQDTSFADRMNSYRQSIPRALTNPVGNGFGGYGSAARQLEEDHEEAIISVDSAILESLFSMGAFVGVGLLLSLIAAVVAAWRRGRTGNDVQRAAGAAVVALAAQLPLGNPLVSAAGVPLWVLLAYLGRISPGGGGGDDPQVDSHDDQAPVGLSR